MGKELLDKNVNANSLIKGKIGRGDEVRFLIHWWHEDSPLMNRFSALINLENTKDATIHMRSRNWDWKREIRGSREQEEWTKLQQVVDGLSRLDGHDKWVWSLDSGGDFLIASCREALGKQTIPFFPYERVKWVPKKINIFAWRAENDRLATLKNLQKRNLLHGSIMCRLCGDREGNANHIFTECFVAALTWKRISIWMKIPPIYAFNFRDLIQMYKNVNGSEQKKRLVKTVVLTICWVVWKAWNDVIFNGKRVSMDGILGEIQSWRSYGLNTDRRECKSIGRSG